MTGSRKTDIRKAAVLLFIACIAIPAALALTVSQDILINRFEAGNNVSHIEEDFGLYRELKKDCDYRKEVRVSNDGTVPCYVRVLAEAEEPEAAEAMELDIDEKDWTAKQQDGYYYYRHVLPPGEQTAPLFTTIKMKEDLNELKIIVYSETVQTAGAEDPLRAFE